MFNERILKFRAWDAKNKKFPFIGFHVIGECTAFDLLQQYRLEEYNDLVISQFTGLKDKNNREIYEGDIVKTDPNHITVALGSNSAGLYSKGVITWLREGFEVCQEQIGATRLSDFASCDCCSCGLEVIGNIFENTELLSKNPELC